MNIAEAARQAVAEGKAITRPWMESRIIIRPTNGPECCQIQIEGSDKPAGNRWNPKADDLLAED